MSSIELSHPSIFVLYGKARSGKSTTIRYLIHHFQTKQLCDFVFVLSGTSFNEYYQQFLPSRQVNLLNLLMKQHLRIY